MVSEHPPRWLRLLTCWWLWTFPVGFLVRAGLDGPFTFDVTGLSFGVGAVASVGTLAVVTARDAMAPIRVVPALCWAAGTLVGYLFVSLVADGVTGPVAVAVFAAVFLVAYGLVYHVDYRALVKRPPTHPERAED